MLRFLTFLLGKQYESCKSCETLKEQLEFERDEKKRLTDMLLEIMKPKVEVQPREIIMEPIQPAMTTFSRKRAALEQKDRLEAQVRANSTVRAEPDSKNNNGNSTESQIANLEKEMGVEE